MDQILKSTSYPDCEPYLVEAYLSVTEMHNRLQITTEVEPITHTYSGWHVSRLVGGAIDDPRNTRPHQVLFAGRYSDAIREEIHHPEVLVLRPNLGSVSQFWWNPVRLCKVLIHRGLEDDLYRDSKTSIINWSGNDIFLRGK